MVQIIETRLSAWPCLNDLIDEEMGIVFRHHSLPKVWKSGQIGTVSVVSNALSECVGRNESKKCSCLNTLNIQSVHRITLYKGKESINLEEIVPCAIEKARQKAI